MHSQFIEIETMRSNVLSVKLNHLKWDSRFFGRSVYSVSDGGCTLDSMKQLLSGAGQTRDIKALIFVQDPDKGFVSAKHPRHWELIDVGSNVLFKLNLQQTTRTPPLNDTVNFSSWSGRQTPQRLRELAIAAGHLSRFRQDYRIGEQLANLLYCQWIEKSITGELADRTFIASRPDREIVAMGTVKLVDNHASIGLIAVHDSMRGKGVGYGLIMHILSWVRAKRCATLNVSTQLSNEAAIHLYQKAGFRTHETKAITHLWVN